ncbi:MAG: hypothetical protein APF84_05410 [Gracilibacter sp. BRH_c7a]|nr:MAG: hypothetical protein APF84_05410 [Gracilibacter sp. BRH_c7a]
MPYIQIQKLSKLYKGQVVIDHISLCVNHGEFVVLVGPSGCGKTTTLKLLAGLIEPDSGSITIDGQNVTNLSAEKRDVVMVFQDNLLFPHITVAQNIGFGLKMKGVKEDKIKAKVQEMLSLIQLEGMEERYPDQLSGGQRQRVALARALALEPKVLLLDEPLSSLDPALRCDMRDFILEIHKTLDMTTICVTHDCEEALHMADKIAAMFEGSIVQYAVPQEIYYRPLSGKVAHLFGRYNILECPLFDGTLLQKCKVLTEAQALTCETVVYVRPESIWITKTPTKDALIGKVLRTIFIGEKRIVCFSYNDKELVAYSWGRQEYKAGDKLFFNIRWEDCLGKSGEEDENISGCAHI